MSNQEIATLLRNVAASYAIKDEKKYKFQIIAYQNAAERIESSTAEVADLLKEERLHEISGIGTSLQAHLEELIATGKVKRFSDIMHDIPPATFPLLKVPSFGPKKAYKLVSHFQLSDPNTVIDDLYAHAQNGEIAQLEGFGQKSEEDIKRAIEEFRLGVNKVSRMVLPFASELAEKMVSYLKSSPAAKEVQPLGSLRRRKETIGDVDIAVATDKPQEVLSHFINYPYKERIIEKGDATASILISGGKHIDLMVQPSDRFGSLLQHFTGSKEHNVQLREYALKKGLSLSEYGIKKVNEGESERIKFTNEEEFYKFLGLSWIPPEIREGTTEIKLAQKNALPKLVELKDIRGDFHLHSNFPIEPSHDLGKNSFEEMLEKALSLGYHYIGFSEHNPSVSKHTSQQTYNLLQQRNKILEDMRLKYNKSIRIFSLLETDILVNGDLGIDEKSLSLLDGILVSIHSGFSMDKKTMTKRVLKGLSHPKAKILSHPTGRLLNQRSGYDLNWKEIFTFCRENNKALEINSWPQRLDLPDSLVQKAIEDGVKFFINTDSHATSHMDLMKYGVSVARRGWATSDDILNTLEYNELKKWFDN